MLNLDAGASTPPPVSRFGAAAVAADPLKGDAAGERPALPLFADWLASLAQEPGAAGQEGEQTGRPRGFAPYQVARAAVALVADSAGEPAEADSVSVSAVGRTSPADEAQPEVEAPGAESPADPATQGAAQPVIVHAMLAPIPPTLAVGGTGDGADTGASTDAPLAVEPGAGRPVWPDTAEAPSHADAQAANWTVHAQGAVHRAAVDGATSVPAESHVGPSVGVAAPVNNQRAAVARVVEDGSDSQPVPERPGPDGSAPAAGEPAVRTAVAAVPSIAPAHPLGDVVGQGGVVRRAVSEETQPVAARSETQVAASASAPTGEGTPGPRTRVTPGAAALRRAITDAVQSATEPIRNDGGATAAAAAGERQVDAPPRVGATRDSGGSAAPVSAARAQAVREAPPVSAADGAHEAPVAVAVHHASGAAGPGDAPLPAAPRVPQGQAHAAHAMAAFHAAAVLSGLETPAAATAAAATAGVADQALLDSELPLQVIQAIRLQWGQGTGEARVRLQPGFLGGLTVGIQVDGSSVVASLNASTADVREWMRTNEPTLRQALADQGLTLERLIIVDEEQAASDEQPRERRERQDQPQQRPRRPSTQNTFELVV